MGLLWGLGLPLEKIAAVSTMLFVTNDNAATGIINRVGEYRIRIPEQVSVMGYDNIKISGLFGVKTVFPVEPRRIGKGSGVFYRLHDCLEVFLFEGRSGK
ncbi:MAG: substrate-binding domain-containing protein, partial [Treponema sp.]|nr:substrate-binding domain-containing protein [Treponema sp.]